MAESYASSSTQTGRSLRPPTASPAARRFHVHTLGCKVNQVDSESMRANLRAYGMVPTDDPHEADVIVVNTCTVTAESDKKSRKSARHFARLDHAPEVLVTGCMPAAGTEPEESLGVKVHLVPKREDVPAAIETLLGLGDHAKSPVSPVRGGRARVQLKVQDGCDNRCSYCIVPRARGGSRSVPVAEVLAAAQAAEESGAREIVLTGIDLGDYRDGGTDVAGLVLAISRVGTARIRLSSIEPMHLRADLLENLADVTAFCRHLHIPLQSGSDQILRAMGRPYTAATFLDSVEQARSALDGLAVTTDLMVGFPGESDVQARESLAVCEDAGFSKMHVFRYSARPGTPAAALDGQVDGVSTRARAEAARSLGETMRERFVASMVDREAQLLVEGPATGMPTGWVEGTTREYLRVIVPADDAKAGTLVRVRIAEPKGSRVLAELL